MASVNDFNEGFLVIYYLVHTAFTSIRSKRLAGFFNLVDTSCRDTLQKSILCSGSVDDVAPRSFPAHMETGDVAHRSFFKPNVQASAYQY